MRLTSTSLLTYLSLAVVSGALAVPTRASAQPVVLSTQPVQQAEQDGTGRVWGIVGYKLCVWGDEEWREVDFSPVPDKKRTNPQSLARGPGGSVISDWAAPGGPFLSRHRGSTSEAFPGPDRRVPTNTVLLDSSDTLWLWSPKTMYRISAEGTIEPAYEIPDMQFHPATPSRNGKVSRGLLSLLEDAEGRFWVWGYARPRWKSRAWPRGVVVADHDRAEYHPTLNGVPDKPFTVLANKRAGALWLGVADDGLYELDSESLGGTRVPEPEPEAFRFVQSLFRAKGDWYLVSSRRRTNRYGPAPATVLWRSRNGSWEKVIASVDALGHSSAVLERAHLETDAGLWLGSFGNGGWLIPNDGGRPIHINWQRGFPLPTVTRIFELNDGRIMTISRDGGWTAVAHPSALLVRRNVADGVQVINVHRKLAPDQRGFVWGVLWDAQDWLSMWDGETWTRYPLPVECDPYRLTHLATDSLGRVWLVHDREEGTTALFNALEQRWETYNNYRAALQAQADKHEGFRFEHGSYIDPVFSSDGRIAFRGFYDICYFDGQAWQAWAGEKIRGGRSRGAEGPPFFNCAGTLCVNINVAEEGPPEWETRAFTEGKRWHKVPYESARDSACRPTRFEYTGPKPDATMDIPHSYSCAQDNLGMVWLTWDKQLYKAAFGRCQPWFDPDKHHPFLDGRTIGGAFVDRRGNTFLEVSWPKSYILLPPRQASPDTEIATAQVDGDSVTVVVSSPSPGAKWFVWRVDGGSWCEPTRDTRIGLTELLGGSHHVEARAIDEDLQADPSPAELSFEIAIDPRQQIAEWIAALTDEDYAKRVAALEKLVHYPDLAIPALNQARGSAPDEQRWWIDAALQRIGAKTGKPSSGEVSKKAE